MLVSYHSMGLQLNILHKKNQEKQWGTHGNWTVSGWCDECHLSRDVTCPWCNWGLYNTTVCSYSMRQGGFPLPVTSVWFFMTRWGGETLSVASVWFFMMWWGGETLPVMSISYSMTPPSIRRALYIITVVNNLNIFILWFKKPVPDQLITGLDLNQS